MDPTRRGRYDFPLAMRLRQSSWLWVVIGAACVAFVVGAGTHSSTAAAQPVRGAPENLLEATDPLELARRVDRFGDVQMLALLEKARPRRHRFAAILGSPFLRAPEAALPRLLPIAAGRDPTLAPAAARAILAIARTLSAMALSAREASSAALRGVIRGLEGLARDQTARGDLRRMAELAALELRALFSSLH